MIDTRLVECLKSCFPKWDGDANSGLKCGDIPGWDSMEAVNLQLELESAFAVDLESFDLRGDTTISQIAKAVHKD